MQGILDTMLTVFNGVKAQGSYPVLLIASLYILYRVNAKKNQWYIYYALLSLVVVCFNPVLVWILSAAFPVLKAYSTFLLFAPVLMYIPFAVAEIMENLKSVVNLRFPVLLPRCG